MNRSNFLWLVNKAVIEWWKPALVMIVLFLSFFLGRQVSCRVTLWSIMALCGLIALILLIHKLDIGLLVLIPIAFFAKWQLGTGTNIPLHAALLLVPLILGIWFLRMIAIERDVRLVPSRVNAPALLFIITTTLSLIIGNMDWFIWSSERASLLAQIGAWMLYTLSISLFLLVGNSIRYKRDLQKMVWLFLILGGIYILGRVSSHGYGPILKYFVPASTGAMFWIWMAALAFGQILFNRGLGWKWQFVLVVLIIGLFATNWLYGRKEWVSGWLPPMVSIFVIIWLRSWKWGIVVTTAAGLVILFGYSFLQSEVMTESQQYSVYSRTATLAIMFEIFKVSPIFGLGPANYHFYTPFFYLLGWQVQFNSHNNYVDILAQTGLLGMITFLWLVIEIAVLTWKQRSRTKDGFMQGYLASALGGLAGLLVSGVLGDWFLPFLYNIGIPGFRASLFAWVFLGGVIAIEHIISRENAVIKN